MRRRGKFVTRRKNKRRFLAEGKSSDDTDEDYVIGEDDESGDSEESCAGDVSEESFDFEGKSDGDEEGEMERKVVEFKPLKNPSGSRKTRVKRSRKRTRVLDDDDDELFDYNDNDDDEEFTPDGIDCLDEEEVERKVDKLIPLKGSSGVRKTRVKPLPKRTRVLYDEELHDYDDDDDDDDDEEFLPDAIDCLDEFEVKKNVDGLKPRKGSSLGRKVRVKQLRKRTSDLDDEELNNDDDDDNDDDTEFTPDGIDFVDEEEELKVNTKKSKLGKRLTQKKLSVKGQRKRKSNFLKKTLTKKRRRSSILKKVVSSDDDFVDEIMVDRKKSKKQQVKRKKRTMLHSDSDLLCSGSSDFEYTISEEERELVREANTFCGDLTTNSTRSSLSKRLQIDGILSRRQRKPLEIKGKEKVEDLQNDVGKQVCGICLSEEGMGTVRGTLNCCTHYFCFACIMEWSKVETRCPLCKQRFVTIRKAAKSNIGIDLRNAVMRVPKRDQVYRPSEEEVRGYLDPYENVVCMECHRGGDDNLMLLCDVCDSPAHTYCVGLGQEVPEGNWYCEGCRFSNPLSSNSLIQDPMPEQATSRGSLPSEPSTCGINVEGFNSSQFVPDPSFSLGIGILPSPRDAVGEDLPVASPVSGSAASTLGGRRRIHRQIHDILSNIRMSQIAEGVVRNDRISHASSENGFFESEVEQGRETTLQNASNTSSERDLFSLRPSHLRRQANQGPSTNTVNDSTHGMLHAEPQRISPISGYGQLGQCSNRPIMDSDASISLDTFREGSRSPVVEDAKEQSRSMMKKHLRR